MHRVGIAAVALWATALAGVLGAQAQLDVTEPQGIAPQTGEESRQPDRCPPFTIAKGEHSGWHHDDAGFCGADFIIGNPDAWGAFWHVHTQQPDPPPPVDFEHRVVVVVVQGLQDTGCGPNISIVAVEPEGPFTRIVAVDDERPGPCDVVTNPFHIVAVCRELLVPPRSVVFQHQRPIPESGTVVGRVFAAPPEEEPFPLPEAHVMLIREGHEPRHAMSGMDGSYFFVNVEPGDYVLLAEHPDFEPAEAPIHVPPDTLVEHDFFLHPRPPEHGAIAGLVLGAHPDHEPFPLPESLVQLFHGDQEVDRRWTNDEGFFLFGHVPPGEYLVVASHEGFFPQEFVAEVVPGEVVEHVFVLEPRPDEPPGAFAGRVLGVLDDDHRIPIPGALVRLFQGDEEIARTHTNWRGMFAIWHVPPGLYVAVAHKPGWLPEDAEVEIRSGEVTHHIFILHGALQPSPFP